MVGTGPRATRSAPAHLAHGGPTVVSGHPNPDGGSLSGKRPQLFSSWTLQTFWQQLLVFASYHSLQRNQTLEYYIYLGKNGKATSTSIKLNGIIINEPEVIASSFNSYFNSIPTTLSNNINNNILTFENYLVDQIPEVENFQQSSIPEITKIITNLKQSNSVGWDKIPTTILKFNINILAPMLSNLINKSLAMGHFPKPLKRAKILPIFKNKDKFDINYRPISILPVISKVCEKFFYNRLCNYFSVYNLISSS